ncbi:hypothetical protein D6833_11745, partial [Candidatus Parcubacteria bacterium]
MISMAWFLSGVSLLCLSGAAAGVLNRKSAFASLTLALLGSLFAAAVSAGVWLGFFSPGEPFVIPLNLWQGLNSNSSLPPLQLTFGMDTLSAFFTFLVAAFSALVAIYSFKALDAEHYRPYQHWISTAFNLFAWTTILVILARDGFSLLLSLELMTLSFGYLVLYKHYWATDAPDRFDEDHQYRYRIAPQVYLMISHTSTAFLLLAVLLLSIHAGSTTFHDWNQQRTSWQGTLPALVFLLALIGLGIRAGLTPAHIWVSLVHPSSPTTTHALSLGIAIKVAIYLMYRFFFEFLPPQAWWGYALLAIAVVTAFVNVWYAISSHDLKEALAYHSIENIGIICAGIGLGLIFRGRVPELALLGLLASLYHLLNHAVFKGLLYLATGAIDNLTHQNVEIDRLGGLIHRYRFTSSMFLVGSFAIAGFPPLNGFISEWLTLKTGLEGLAYLGNSSPLLFVAVLLSMFLLVTSFALTAFCFYKMAGVALLGLPRLPESERQDWEPDDVPLSMKTVMGLMAALCLLLGIFPAWVAPQLAKALQPLGITGETIAWSLTLVTPESIPAAQPGLPALVGLLLVTLFVHALLIFAMRRAFRVPVRRVPAPWNCGESLAKPPFHQFSSGGLSYSLRKLFAFLNTSAMQSPDYLPARLPLSQSEDFPQETVEVFRLAYNRITARLLRFSDAFALWLQNGDIRRYMTYV